MATRSTSSAPRTTAPVAGSKAPAHEQIARLAYQKWHQRGCPHGSDHIDWYAAEAELRGAEDNGAATRRKAKT